ncbi:MAG TPA: TIM barrel protein [Bryobacteraceae bacterium]|nr:TIM barrel protein [Bryobacteraceae bacterium]
MTYTRRALGKMALAALPVAKLMAKPNSKFGGVQIGINMPYSMRNMSASGDEILDAMLQLGLNAIELRSQPVEAFLGVPANLVPARGGGRGGARGGEGAQKGGRAPLTSEQEAAQRAKAGELRKWRLAVSMEKVKPFRKKWEDQGVPIEIVKFDGIDAMADDEVDYCFDLAKALGATAISCEIPLSRTKRLGAFGDKHKMRIGYHGHADVTSPEAFGRPESWETAMSYSKYNCINLDIGHFFAGNGFSPVEYIKKHNDRITHIHLKDRKRNNGPNVPWGQGDTPVKEVLRLMQTEKYKFQATIEQEYPVPEGSNIMAELAKCVQFCKDALSG